MRKAPRSTRAAPARTKMVPSEVEFDVTDESAVASVLGAHVTSGQYVGRPYKSSQADAPPHYGSVGRLRTKRS